MSNRKPVAKTVNAEVSVKEFTDERGRQLTHRKLSLMEVGRLSRAIGGVHSKNDMFLGLASAAASIRSIGGIPSPFPTTMQDVDAAIERLGEEGLFALNQFLMDEFDNQPEAGPVELKN